MKLLDALRALDGASRVRLMRRTDFIAAVNKLVPRVLEVLRVGDTSTVGGNIYAVLQHESIKVLTVDDGRSPAVIGPHANAVLLPHASFDHHVFFVENISSILAGFQATLQNDSEKLSRVEKQAYRILHQEMEKQ